MYEREVQKGIDTEGEDLGIALYSDALISGDRSDAGRWYKYQK